MTKTQKFLSRSALSTGVLGLALLAAPAFAQDKAAAAETPEDAGTIVVTGTLIKNPNLVASSPVSVVGAEEISLKQSQTAEQLLRELPGAVPGLGSSVNNGSTGASYVDLRGLGSNRNIVLLDGARIVPGDFNGQVDLNNIPLALVERVDVLTGGASTTYGADAISGVVNFITKKNFSGLDLSVSNEITDKGDANYFRADITVGANFDDGRGNAVLSIGYQQADPLYFSGRKFSRNQINSTSGNASGGSDTSVPASFALPDNTFLQVNPTGTGLAEPYQKFNFNPYNIFVTPFERFNMFGAAHYDVSDTIEVYTRAMFSKNSVKSIVAPSGIFGEELTVSSTNPFLSTGLRDQLCAANGVAAGACVSGTPLTLSEVYRRTVEIGPRISDYQTTIFDYTAGARFKVTESTNFELSGSYGQSENTQSQSGYVLKSRVVQALNAVDANNCVDPSNGCVPLNLFGGAGSITPDMAAFLNGKSTITNKASLAQVRALYSGDFGIASPGASDPIGFAVGGEYRKYKAQTIPDALALVPGELGGAGGAVLPLSGGYHVYEAFGELIAPLVQDKPFAKSLTFEAGVRYSKYKVDAAGSPSFSTTTYKAGGSWEPLDMLKIRGNYQRAVRAPNIGELFAPVVTGLNNAPDGLDPCVNGGLPITNPNLAAVCIAQGAPAGLVASGGILDPAAGQVNVTGGGNPNIKPEKADTYTVGLVIQPISGLSVTVDYYNITVNNAITLATPSDIIGACFDNLTAASATDIACTSIRRSTATGRLSGSPATVAGLPQPLTNNGRIKTDGIDVSVNYKHEFDFATLNVGLNGNWTRHSKFKASSTSVDRECVGSFSVNCGLNGSIQPEFYWNQRTTLSFKKFDVSLLWRHIDSVNYEQAPDLDPLFNGTISGGSLDGKKVNFNHIKAYDYFDLAFRTDVTDNVELTFTMTNMFDKKPPIVGSTAGSTSFNSGNTYPSTYDAVGRRFTAGARLKF